MPAKSLTLNIPMLAMGKARPRVYRGRAFMPTKYRKWKADFCFHAKLQALDDVFDGNFHIILTVLTKTGRCPSDMDNCLGSVLDALQDCGIVANDKKNRAGAYWLSDEKHETDHMIVSVSEMSPDKYPVKTTKKKARK